MTRRLAVFGAAAVASVALAPGATAMSTMVNAQDNVFAPTRSTATVGTPVVFTNTGKAPHEVTAVDGSFQSGNIAAGKTWSFTPAKAGSYAYYCRYHGTATAGMTGTLVVAAVGHPRSGGGREVQLGLALLAVTVAVGTGLRLAGRTR